MSSTVFFVTTIRSMTDYRKMRQIFTICVLLVCTWFCEGFPNMDSYLGMGGGSDEHGQQSGSKSTNCSCGWTNKARIVGGKETLANEYPPVAGLSTETHKTIFCGVTIITPYHTITAAHCTHSIPNEKFIVIVGEHDQTRTDDSSSTLIIPVEKVINHENYVPRIFHNDITLLVLSKEITFTQTVGPICLPAKRIPLLNEQVKVLGWGKLGTWKKTSNVLMKVNTKVVPLEKCKEDFPTKDIRLENPKQICTFEKKKDSCQGDSGGPLLWLDPETNRYTLVALVSYGKNKCGKDAGAVNTEVTQYLDWIQEKISSSKPGYQTCAKVD